MSHCKNTNPLDNTLDFNEIQPFIKKLERGYYANTSIPHLL